MGKNMRDITVHHKKSILDCALLKALFIFAGLAFFYPLTISLVIGDECWICDDSDYLCDADYADADYCGCGDDWVVDCADCDWICDNDSSLAYLHPDEDCDADGIDNEAEDALGTDPCDETDVDPRVNRMT